MVRLNVLFNSVKLEKLAKLESGDVDIFIEKKRIFILSKGVFDI